MSKRQSSFVLVVSPNGTATVAKRQKIPDKFVFVVSPNGTATVAKCQKIPDKSLDDLPDEVLLKVFANLAKPCSLKDLVRSSHVSKRIRRVCHDESLWPKINLFKKYIPAEFIKHILQNGCRYLSLCDAKVKGHTIKMLNEKSQLRYLDLSNFKNEVFVGELLESCHFLEKLSLKYSTFSSAMMRNLNSGYLNFDNLEVLDMTGCKGLDMGTIRQIVMFENLSEINFSWPPTGGGLSTAMIGYLVKNISIHLRKISLNSQINVRNEHIATLVTRCNEIRELQLFGDFGITNNSLDIIMKGLRKLEKLDISLTQIDLTKILELRSMPELHNLNCQHVETIGDIKKLKKILPHLIINQERFKIADRSQTLKPEQGFWDVQAEAVQDMFAVNEQEQHGINLGGTY